MVKQVTSAHQPRNLAEWLAYIAEIHVEAIELGLDRVADVYSRLSSQHEKRLVIEKPLAKKEPVVITFAGTNGKGSTLAMVEALALENKKNVGAYTSPHIIRFNERIRINGSDVSDKRLTQSFINVEIARKAIPLTYFEFTTLVALDLFICADLDYWLLEVGLGGRLDAVNIIDPDIAVITTVDLDHQEWLGSDRNKIGFEKAGILRAGIPVVLGSTDLPSSVFRKASELGTNNFVLAKDFSLKNHQFFSRRTQYRSEQFALDLLKYPDLPSDNIATALQTARIMGLPLKFLESRPFPELALQGRFQLIKKNPTIVLDVAHNPHAARYLASWLDKNPVQGRDIAVFSSLQDKDVKSIVAALYQHFHQWHLFKINDPRAMDLALLQNHVLAGSSASIQSSPVTFDPLPRMDGDNVDKAASLFLHESIEEALAFATAAAGQHGRILVFGSFMAVAAVFQTGIISAH